MYNADETSQKISDLEKEYRKSQQKKGAESLMELEDVYKRQILTGVQ